MDSSTTEVAIDKKKVHLEHPLKALGDHELELRLHPEVTTTLKVRINSDKPQPQAVEAPPSSEAKTREGETAAKAETRKARPFRKPRPEKKP